MSEIRVFYSWQADLPRETNNHAIRMSIKRSCLNIEQQIPELQFIIDEATREVSGSPHIPSTIFDKITKCDIFISDISVINNHDIDHKKISNPNVLIELGYAVNIVGWERIILLFNKQFGSFPADIPFDIDRHRALDYKVVDANDNSGKGQLKKNLTDAIDLIVKNNPDKPVDKYVLTPEQKKRKNDIKSIEVFFNSIHLISMDDFIENLPNIVPSRIFFFWEEFNAKTTSSYFFIYDEEIKTLFNNFRAKWGESLSFGHRYNYNDRTENHMFISQMDTFSKAQQEDYDKILSIRQKLYNIYKELVSLIRTKWLEVDIMQCSDNAINNYIESQEKMQELYKM